MQTALLANPDEPREATGRTWRFEVVGHPETQGSKKGFADRRGFVRVVDDNKAKLEPWRRHVAEVARAALPDWLTEPIDGPVFLALIFFRARSPDEYLADGRTLSAAGRRRPYPETAPDTTKLTRAVEDALQGIAYTNDSRIVTSVNCKRWADWNEQERVVVELAAL